MNTRQHIERHLLPEIHALRERALLVERAHHHVLAAVAPSVADSARNLLHYTALRQRDLRTLQRELGLLGLTRLGRAEAHTLGSLDAVEAALCSLAGRAPPRHRNKPTTVDLHTGADILRANARALLGEPKRGRATRIMVTLPTEAAHDAALLRALLLAGMNVARINTAHDDAETWLAMVARLRAAQRETGRRCKIYVDLAGPKVRTGALASLGRLLDFGPKRDRRGAVLTPARVVVEPSGAPKSDAHEGEVRLPISEGVLARAREGDELLLHDCRGKERVLTLVSRRGSGWLAHASQHVYVESGAKVSRLRKGEVRARGAVGPLPDVVEPLLLRVGDRLRLVREGEVGGPATLDERGRVVRPATIPCTLVEAFRAVSRGHRVLFDDGKLGGEVITRGRRHIDVEITHAAPRGSKLASEKGVNLPDTALRVPALGPEDEAVLRILAPHVDVVGLSFVRGPADVLALHAALDGANARPLGIVAKIETPQAFATLPHILLAGLRRPPFGVMVARGDLAVEVGFERMAEVQEEILWLCEAAHVPVIWATQVLETMAKRGLPSRAEISDASLGVRAECVMLNKGPYIVETVRVLADILSRMSAHRAKGRPLLRELSVSRMGRAQPARRAVKQKASTKPRATSGAPKRSPAPPRGPRTRSVSAR